jgi:hypothetical protein
MKRLLLIVSCALGILLLPPLASADKPTRTVIPSAGDFISTECGFKVAVHVEQDQFAILTFVDDEGNVVREILTGAIKWTLTNVKTGESIFVNLSGPGFFSANADGSSTFVGTGPWVFFENFETGDLGLLLLTGKFEIAFDAEGNVEFSRVGRTVIDLCAELAA